MPTISVTPPNPKAPEFFFVWGPGCVLLLDSVRCTSQVSIQPNALNWKELALYHLLNQNHLLNRNK